MALRLSSPTNEHGIQSAGAPLAYDAERPELADTPTNPLSTGVSAGLAEPAVEATLPTIDALALNLEQAKQQELNARIENPQAISLLAARLSDANGKGLDDMPPSSGNRSDADIVQDYRFVQPDAGDSHFVFLPSQLINLADQIKQKTGIDLRQQRLDGCRRQLQEARQQMISANTGLVAFVAYPYKTCISAYPISVLPPQTKQIEFKKPKAFPLPDFINAYSVCLDKPMIKAGGNLRYCLRQYHLNA